MLLTKKAVRGRNAKWTLKDLPPGTAEEFTAEVVPLVREKADAHIIDRVYGKDKHEVKKDGAWAVLEDGEEKGEAEMHEETTPTEDASILVRRGIIPDGGVTPASGATAALKFDFSTLEGISEFVLALAPHESGTMAFQRKQWVKARIKSSARPTVLAHRILQYVVPHPLPRSLYFSGDNRGDYAPPNAQHDGASRRAPEAGDDDVSDTVVVSD
ncbi:hypothetical protein R3P38DRAFT_2797050 [Favolaschia claudopus]|uniref:Uncharacterized protein n=1 Tax=Favolaschia claudopus TaxID=2862362 RepID=A0AAW0A3Q8_9AGAR